MKVNLLVNCQYYENYNVSDEGWGEVPYWKPKGGISFLMPIDSDYLIYAEESQVIQSIKNVLGKWNSISCRADFRDYEIQWSKPDRLGGLEEELKSMMDEVAV
jgi:hypothetical protein